MKINILILTFLITGFTFQNLGLKFGRYHTIKKHNSFEIQINEDSTFVFHKNTYYYSYGKWKFENEYLVCYSPELTAEDSMRIGLMGGTYFKIESMRFKIIENAIVDIDTKTKYNFTK